MADGRADLAVHSLKDVPMDMPGRLRARRRSPRARIRAMRSCRNRYDALAELPDGAVVGTSSLRREAQLRERYPARS